MTGILKTNSINFAGAGSNIVEASMPALENGNQNNVGMIAFTDNESYWEAGEGKPGVFYVPIDLENYLVKLLFENIKKVRDDVKIFSEVGASGSVYLLQFTMTRELEPKVGIEPTTRTLRKYCSTTEPLRLTNVFYLKFWEIQKESLGIISCPGI